MLNALAILLLAFSGDIPVVEPKDDLVITKPTRIKPGTNFGMGRDFTLFAAADGFVCYEQIQGGRKRVSVHPTRS